ncbi:MAG: hypothetical protein SXU28_02205 [Pseudomonadota bacterium]|nr:hypothetical protein [Pseudomonadota bacterium]
MPSQPPAIMQIGTDRICHGLALVQSEHAQLPDLTAIRDAIADIRIGKIGASEQRSQVMIVTFRKGETGISSRFPSALPLVATGPGTLSSYLAQDAPAFDNHKTAFRTIRLWWRGQPHQLWLHQLESVSRKWLWQVPAIIVHPSTSPSSAHAHSKADSIRTDEGSASASRKPAKPFGSDIAQGLAARLLESDEKSARDPFFDLRDGLNRPPAFGERLRGFAWHLPAVSSGIWELVKAIILIAVILIGVAFLVAIVVSGGGVFIPFLIGFFVWQFLRGFFGGSKEGNNAVAPARSGEYRGPGMFENFLGWLAWKNPFSGVHKQLNRRVKQVEGMIARGQIDDALKLALRLGGPPANDRKQKTVYPRQLPSARARLDFEYGDSPFASPILGEMNDWELRQSYYNLADKLEKEGDFRRAAFILSQLLGEHERAVLLLEKGDLEDEALRLALGSKINPVICVRLLYSAGRKDDALAFAMRANCFEELVEQSRGKDAEFHVDVVKAWTDALIESGQVLRAVQVTDGLANEIGANATLLSLRKSWLMAHCLQNEGNGFSAEPLVRAILMGSLTDAGILESYPERAIASGDDLLDLALDRLREPLLNGDGGDELLSTLAAFKRLSSRKSPEQEAFWSGPAAAVIECLTKGLIRRASDRLQAPDLDALADLLNMAGHRVLARDLTKLTKLQKAGNAPSREWSVPDVMSDAPRAVIGCLMGNGAMLVWRSTEVLQLLDSKGAVRWQERLEHVTSIIPVGQGGKALILRKGAGSQTRISCFDTTTLELRDVGSIALFAYHDMTTELSWLVQVSGRIGALNLSRLTGSNPDFEFLWSCALTDRLQVTGFCQGKSSASWATVDISPDRLGVQEIWTHHSNGELNTFLLEPGADAQTQRTNRPMLWAWQGDAGNWLSCLEPGNGLLLACLWSEYHETKVRDVMAKRAREEGIDQLVPCDFGRSAAVTLGAGQGEGETARKTTVRSIDVSGPQMTLIHDEDIGLTCLARAAVANPDRLEPRSKQNKVVSGRVLLADRHGRLFLVDPRTARVTQF